MRFEFNDDSQKICNSVDVVNYGIQCDICGNKVLSVSNINGKRYCAGCYYKTFMKDNQKAEIDQLKQQLAEKDKEINSLIVDYEKRISQEQELMSNMEHQLAEKDKEIETMKKDSDKNIDYLVEFASLIENEKDCNRMLKALDRVKSGNKYIIDKANQSKTEFAITELEKVKNFVDGRTYCANYIKKRIKELKGEKDVED